MKIIVSAVSVTAAVGLFVGDVLAQSQGPLTTMPWASRSRAKPNPTEPSNAQTADPTGQQIFSAPPAAKPVDGAPEPEKPKTADR